MTTTNISTSTSNNFKVYGDFYLRTFDKWQEYAERFKKLVNCAQTLYLPKSAQTLKERSKMFWSKANTILALLDQNRTGTGSRTLRKAFTLYNELAKSVHDTVDEAVYTVCTARKYKGYTAFIPYSRPYHQAMAAAVVKADKLGKGEYKSLLYVLNNNDSNVLVRLIGKKNVSVEFCSKRYLSKDRQFILPRTYNVMTLLYQRTLGRCWWGAANTLYWKEAPAKRTPIPTL